MPSPNSAQANSPVQHPHAHQPPPSLSYESAVDVPLRETVGLRNVLTWTEVRPAARTAATAWRLYIARSNAGQSLNNNCRGGRGTSSTYGSSGYGGEHIGLWEIGCSIDAIEKESRAGWWGGQVVMSVSESGEKAHRKPRRSLLSAPCSLLPAALQLGSWSERRPQAVPRILRPTFACTPPRST